MIIIQQFRQDVKIIIGTQQQFSLWQELS